MWLIQALVWVLDIHNITIDYLQLENDTHTSPFRELLWEKLTTKYRDRLVPIQADIIDAVMPYKISTETLHGAMIFSPIIAREMW